jgi:hypothetical protein
LKNLFTEFLVNRSSPAPFTWLNLYLEKIRSKIFSMDNVLQMIEGHRVGLCIDAILDNIFKFGRKDERSMITSANFFCLICGRFFFKE